MTFNVVVGDPDLLALTAEQPDEVPTVPVEVVVAGPAAKALAALDPEADEAVRVVDALTDEVYLVVADDGGFLAFRDDAETFLLGADWALAVDGEVAL
jgi:hypothetical protein